MENEELQPKRKGRARERIQARQARQQVAFTPFSRVSSDADAAVPVPNQRGLRWARQRRPETGYSMLSWQERLRLKIKDILWYTVHRPYVLRGVTFALIGVFVLYVLAHVFTGKLFPNVWSLGVHMGDMTIEEAAAALQTAWANEIEIDVVDGDRVWTVRPLDIGLSLDAEATAESARGVGLAGMPLGYSVLPVVNIDLFTVQDYLLNLTEVANFAPYNAGFEWQADQLVSVAGRDGRVLDVGQTMEQLRADPARIADSGRLELVMQPIEPEIADAGPYLAEARALVAEPFLLTAYDPFRDEHMTWTTDRDTLTSWIDVGVDGLGLRRDVFAAFIQAQNATLNAGGEEERFLESTQTMEQMESAIRGGAHGTELRVRYHQAQYQVIAGDTGYRIARKTGIPFYLLTNANPGLEWEQLSVGETITLPSRDVTLPAEVIAEKRIIVNLDTQWLVAYENGQEVFRWLISSGTSDFPTYPGVYQILSHEETALGSTYELCGSSGCGQWEMYWFMGIYEVVPGLMNGFHGAVLLPNGAYLGGGNVGSPYTYGCVMSEDSNARQLYQWAAQGTIVEIVSSDYPPQSDLARQAFPEMASLIGVYS